MNKTKNNEIRQKAKSAGVNLWQISEALGMSEFTFSRKLRHELPEEERLKILGIIERIAKEGGAE